MPVLLGAGTRDIWYTAERASADEQYLASRAIPHEIVRFDGGHEWTAEFRDAAGRWLDALRAP